MLALRLLTFLVSFGGLLLGSLCFLSSFLKKEAHLLLPSEFFKPLLLIPLAWFFSLGCLGAISSIMFYLDQEIWITQVAFVLLGIWGGTFFFIKRHQFSLKFTRNLSPRPKRSAWEYLALSASFLLILNYFYRSGVPWFDQDEITQYGMYSKLIANGWGFRELFHFFADGHIKFAESLYAHLYSLSQSNLPVRLFKLVSLILLSTGLYGFLLACEVPKKWAIFSLPLFLGVPELGYLAISTKVDSTLMMFELCAYLLFLLPLTKAKSMGLCELAKTPRFFLLACVFSYMAVVTRVSGIYGALVINACCLLVVLTSKEAPKQKMLIITAMSLIALLFAHPYLVHMYEFDNPLFPFKSPWPFDGGTYERTVHDWKSVYNVKLGLPPLFYQLYMILHVGLGLETSFYNALSFLPHAQAKGVSIGWHTPALIAFFFVPFFWTKIPRIRPLAIFLFLLFTAWTYGVQHSRVFLATTSLSIPLLLLMMTSPLQSSGPGIRFLQLLLKQGTVLIVLFSLAYHSIYSFKKYPHSWKSFYDAQARYESNKKVMTGHSGHFGLVSLDHKQKDDLSSRFILPSFEFTQKLSSFLLQHPKMKILMLHQQDYAYHLFFPTGAFLKGELNDTQKITIPTPGVTLKSLRNRPQLNLMDFDCILKAPGPYSETQMTLIRHHFPKEIFSLTQGPSTLLCKEIL